MEALIFRFYEIFYMPEAIIEVLEFGLPNVEFSTQFKFLIFMKIIPAFILTMIVIWIFHWGLIFVRSAMNQTKDLPVMNKIGDAYLSMDDFLDHYGFFIGIRNFIIIVFIVLPVFLYMMDNLEPSQITVMNVVFLTIITVLSALKRY